ncbi:MAG: hypothetical protein LAO05_18570, partial [Acidobacteriia bacterium]|nr:hypothetical protein [Terriglobia bacterium]
PTALAEHGAFNISLINDLPLFIDPFLLFNSDNPNYQQLHADVIAYLRFLRDQSARGALPDGLLKAWFMFPEVKQTWLGFSQEGNCGSGLGPDFAHALNENLHTLLANFGEEQLTRGSHLEKLCLINEGVGRDNISDFTTHLIRDFLARYTEEFAHKYLALEQYRRFAVAKARFNYETRTWETRHYDLPFWKGDYILLTPEDMLTKDETWISRRDLLHRYEKIANSVDDVQLRAQLNEYLRGELTPDAKGKDREAVVAGAIRRFPQVIEYYIREREDHGDEAVAASEEQVAIVRHVFIDQVRSLALNLRSTTSFYEIPGDTLDEARTRLAYLRDVIENKGGHKIFYVDGEPLHREADLHVLYRLTWFATPSDVSQEVNDGRGPADFKVSRGAFDKTLIEFKLASNTKLRRNLERQTEVYSKASDTRKVLKAILYFTEEELLKVDRILRDLKLSGDPDIVLIDARADNKPSGSNA